MESRRLGLIVFLQFIQIVTAIRPSDELFKKQQQQQVQTKLAVFALGSFWSGEAAFGCAPGVVRTRVGYCGGSKINPEYRNIGDQAESVEVEYDPSVISYEQLLGIFWSSHDPTQVFGQGPDVGEQYRSIIFTQGDEEAKLAAVSKEREQRKRPEMSVLTEIEPLEIFYPAESEHQKFELRRRPLLLQLFGELSEEDFLRSSAATRFNGYAAGTCSPSLQSELDKRVAKFLRLREMLVKFSTKHL